MVLTRRGKGRAIDDTTAASNNADANSNPDDNSEFENATNAGAQVNGERQTATEAGDLTADTAYPPSTDVPNGTTDYGQGSAAQDPPVQDSLPADGDLSDGARITRSRKAARRATRSTKKSPPENSPQNANPGADEETAPSAVSESIEQGSSISPQSVQKKTAKKKAPKAKKAKGTKPRRSNRLRQQRDEIGRTRPPSSGNTPVRDLKSPTINPTYSFPSVTNTGFGQTPVFRGGTRGLTHQEIDDDFDEIDERQQRNLRRAQREAQPPSDPDETEEETPPPIRFRGPRRSPIQIRNVRRSGRGAARDGDSGENTNTENTTRTIKAATTPKTSKSPKKGAAKKPNRKNGPGNGSDDEPPGSPKPNAKKTPRKAPAKKSSRKNGSDDESEDEAPGPSRPPTNRTPKKTTKAQESEAQKHVVFEISGDDSDNIIESVENAADKRTITATKKKGILKVSEVVSSATTLGPNNVGTPPARRTRKRKKRYYSYRSGELPYLDDESDNQLNRTTSPRKRSRPSPMFPSTFGNSDDHPENQLIRSVRTMKRSDPRPAVPSSASSTATSSSAPDLPSTPVNRRRTPDDAAVYDFHSSGSARRKRKRADTDHNNIASQDEDDDAKLIEQSTGVSRKRGRGSPSDGGTLPSGMPLSEINGQVAEETAEPDSTQAASTHSFNVPAFIATRMRAEAIRAYGEIRDEVDEDTEHDDEFIERMTSIGRTRARRSPRIMRAPQRRTPLPRINGNGTQVTAEPNDVADAPIHDTRSSDSAAARRRHAEALAECERIIDEQEDEDAVNAGIMPPRSRRRTRRTSPVRAPPNGISFSGLNGHESDDEEETAPGTPRRVRRRRKRR